MKLEIIAHTPDIENVIAAGGRLCYSKVGVAELLEKHSKEDNERFVKMLADMGHESPLEHVSFTFAVEGVSRALSHQLVRHRIASYSQQSQRYVDLEDTFEYITPTIFEDVKIDTPFGKSDLKEMYDTHMKMVHCLYTEMTKTLEDRYYEEEYSKLFYLREQQQMKLSEKDIKNIKSKANKKAIEDARYILPNACETKLVFTMNVRTLLHFLEKRCCTRAQWEIRELANEMLRQLKEISPILFNNAGKPCLRGKCTEGDMACSK